MFFLQKHLIISSARHKINSDNEMAKRAQISCRFKSRENAFEGFLLMPSRKEPEKNSPHPKLKNVGHSYAAQRNKSLLDQLSCGIICTRSFATADLLVHSLHSNLIVLLSNQWYAQSTIRDKKGNSERNFPLKFQKRLDLLVSFFLKIAKSLALLLILRLRNEKKAPYGLHRPSRTETPWLATPLHLRQSNS